MSTTTFLLYAAILTWLMIMAASTLRSRGDLRLAIGNRHGLPPATPIAERADRAARNMLENLVLFIALVVAVGDRNPARAELGAQVFLIARILYWPIYLAGIPGVRTAVWTVGVVGLALVASAGF